MIRRTVLLLLSALMTPIGHAVDAPNVVPIKAHRECVGPGLSKGRGGAWMRRFAWMMLVAFMPIKAIACMILDSLDAQLARAVESSEYVFVAKVGSTVRVESPDPAYGSALMADMEVLERFKGPVREGDRLPMLLKQPFDENKHTEAFAWEGDRVLVFARSLPVSEADFCDCGICSMVIGDEVQPRSDHPLVKPLRFHRRQVLVDTLGRHFGYVAQFLTGRHFRLLDAAHGEARAMVFHVEAPLVMTPVLSSMDWLRRLAEAEPKVTTDLQCRRLGGTWRRAGEMGRWGCDIPTGDGGQGCADHSDCEAYCATTDSSAAPGSVVNGECSESFSVIGKCPQPVSRSIAEYPVCFD